MLGDLSTLPPKPLGKRLEKLATDALPCLAVTVFDGNEDDGLTVALHVDSRKRADVLDLARVIEDDPVVNASCGWSLLPSTRRRHDSLLLLRVSFERPVSCTFTVSFEAHEDNRDPIRAGLPLLLASDRLIFAFDEPLDPNRPLVWISSPVQREPVLDLLATVSARYMRP